MTVDSYFPGSPDVRMKENPGDTDAAGIRYQGKILTGTMVASQVSRKQAGESCGARKSILPRLLSGLTSSPGPASPPLPNAADRLVSVDPVTAAQLAEYVVPPSTCYVHPEQYDAVVRSQPRMDPAQDAYEYRRKCEEHWRSVRDQHVVR